MNTNTDDDAQNCELCGQDAACYAPVRPIYVEISDPEFFTDTEVGCTALNFCSWRCLADWAAVQAVITDDSPMQASNAETLRRAAAAIAAMERVGVLMQKTSDNTSTT